MEKKYHFTLISLPFTGNGKKNIGARLKRVLTLIYTTTLYLPLTTLKKTMKKHLFILLLCACFLIMGSCSTIKTALIPTSNKGGYTINFINQKSNNNSDEVIISGKVYDVRTGNIISNAILTSGCLKIEASSNGEYSFQGKKSTYGCFFIKSLSYGYKTIETNFIDMNNTNEINIDFYLTQDDRPIINCEGGRREFKTK